MCGIAGLFSTTTAIDETSSDAVRRMTDSMRLRGPDAEGLWTGQGVALGHRRLAIIDLDRRSNQPMVTSDESHCIVFNGEIYNFRELRRELEAAGVVLRTGSDTEILLALFVREGERMLRKLRGMFAFAIWSVRSRELFLARDPYGIKPLYYAETMNGLLFASQVKALMASGMISSALETAGVAGFYLWGSVPEPWTLYRGVLCLPAGCWMRVRAGRAHTPVCWSDIRVKWREEGQSASEHEAQDCVRQAVSDSVRAHLVSDVPVCVLLSGGIDSGAVAGVAHELGAKVEGITIGFDEFSSLSHDEVPPASTIAAHYGIPHHVRRISRDEFERDTPAILQAMDQPSIDGVNTWFASKAVAERGYKVALSGTGGDELFHGYALMQQIPCATRLMSAIASIPGARALLKAPFAHFAKRRSQPKYRGVAEFMGSLEGLYFLKRALFLPEELPMLMGEERAREGLSRLGGSPPGIEKSGILQGALGLCQLDSTLYLRNQLLRDNDWASMHFSVELRTPLVDASLLDTLKQYLKSFGSGAGKRMLACSPGRQLPEAVMRRTKSGFNVPMAKWLASVGDPRRWMDHPLLAAPGTPWARRWAHAVMEATTDGAGSSAARLTRQGRDRQQKAG
jgi:asparagine synthase (glutamine-hydrolysing)